MTALPDWLGRFWQGHRLLLADLSPSLAYSDHVRPDNMGMIPVGMGLVSMGIPQCQNRRRSGLVCNNSSLVRGMIAIDKPSLQISGVCHAILMSRDFQQSESGAAKLSCQINKLLQQVGIFAIGFDAESIEDIGLIGPKNIQAISPA